MQYINKDKLIKILQNSKSKDFGMKKLERILKVYGDTYYAEGCRMELCKKGKEIGKELTYEELFHKFNERYSYDIDDYRPAGAYTIRVWLKDGQQIQAVYSVEEDSFKLYKPKEDYYAEWDKK